MPGLALHERLQVPIGIDDLSSFVHCRVVHAQVRRELVGAEIPCVDALPAHFLQNSSELLSECAFIGHKLGQRSFSEFGCWNHSAPKSLRE